MPLIPRYYQTEAIDAGVKFFSSNRIENGIEICPTGSGKSVIIANIAKELDGRTIVFQPSKEILAQNFSKLLSYGYRASIYSASGGMKIVDKITYATIGSVYKKPSLFKEFKNIIIDECHLVNPEDGMYQKFLSSIDGKILGLTATPYRLSSGVDGAMLKFITRTRPKIFNKVLYMIQNGTLFNEGHLAPLEYYDIDMIDRARLIANKSGTDFTEESMRDAYERGGGVNRMKEIANRILNKRKSLLVFCNLIREAYQISAGIPGSVVIEGGTSAADRDRRLKDFTRGKISCVVNVGVLDTGFDYPELEAVLDGSSTMSLAKYYQRVGRVMRPYTYPDGSKKVGWYVDLGGNSKCFGKIETMLIETDKSGLHFISNVVDGRRRQLTNVNFSKN